MKVISQIKKSIHFLRINYGRVGGESFSESKGKLHSMYLTVSSAFPREKIYKRFSFRLERVPNLVLSP